MSGVIRAPRSTKSLAVAKLSWAPRPMTCTVSWFSRANCSTSADSRRQVGQCGAQNQTSTGRSPVTTLRTVTAEPSATESTSTSNTVSPLCRFGRFSAAACSALAPLPTPCEVSATSVAREESTDSAPPHALNTTARMGAAKYWRRIERCWLAPGALADLRLVMIAQPADGLNYSLLYMFDRCTMTVEMRSRYIRNSAKSVKGARSVRNVFVTAEVSSYPSAIPTMKR